VTASWRNRSLATSEWARHGLEVTGFVTTKSGRRTASQSVVISSLNDHEFVVTELVLSLDFITVRVGNHAAFSRARASGPPPAETHSVRSSTDRGSCASSGRRVTRIQLPAGSTMLNPLSPALFARCRGRVMRGNPFSGTRLYQARRPWTNSSCSGALSKTTMEHVEWLCSGSTWSMP
jgi:hypothetical protein